MLIIIATATIVAVLMEGWSAVIHRHGWHGRLWWTHRSHHRGRGDVAHIPGLHPPALELNDFFGLLHAAVAAPAMALGITYRHILWGQIIFGASIGMTIFGVAYALIHDGLAHGRLPVSFLKRSRLLWRVAAAHRVHHRTGGAPYGLFSGPYVLRRLKKARRTARS